LGRADEATPRAARGLRGACVRAFALRGLPLARLSVHRGLC